MGNLPQAILIASAIWASATGSLAPSQDPVRELVWQSKDEAVFIYKSDIKRLGDVVRGQMRVESLAPQTNWEAWEGGVSIDCSRRLYYAPDGSTVFMRDKTVNSTTGGPAAPAPRPLRNSDQAIRLIAKRLCA
jgi:hypothetical protein